MTRFHNRRVSVTERVKGEYVLEFFKTAKTLEKTSAHKNVRGIQVTMIKLNFESMVAMIAAFESYIESKKQQNTGL